MFLVFILVVSHEVNELKLEWSVTEPAIIPASSLRQQNAYLVKNASGECDIKHTWRGNLRFCYTIHQRSLAYTVVYFVTDKFISITTAME